MLGTVQFGLEYGIGNQSGRPDYRTCLAIVEAALECGIHCFDTAAAYGESERVLGRVLAELNATGDVVVASKCLHLRNITGEMTANTVAAFVEESLRRSLANLQLEALPVYLYHSELDIVWMEVLTRFREMGRVGSIGISVDSGEGALNAASHPMVEALQIPYNLLDHRISHSRVPQLLQRGKARVFARSAFLQGLLLMPEERIPEQLSTVIPVRRELNALASQAGMDMTELCLRYSLSCPAIDYVLIGVDSVEQLRANAAAAAKGPLEEALLAAVDAAVPDFPENIVRPIMWNQNKPAKAGPTK